MIENESDIHIKIITMDNQRHNIVVNLGMFVPELKALVQIKTGIEISRQRVIHRGKVLENDKTLRNYHLEDGHTVHVVARPEGYIPPPFTSSSSDDPRPLRSPTASRNNNIPYSGENILEARGVSNNR